MGNKFLFQKVEIYSKNCIKKNANKNIYRFDVNKLVH